jgi:tellurite resistance protein
MPNGNRLEYFPISAFSIVILRVRFTLPWWAYSFPMASLTAAVFTFYQLNHAPAFALMGGVFPALLSMIVLILFTHTVIAAVRGTICVPDA